MTGLFYLKVQKTMTGLDGTPGFPGVESRSNDFELS